jgi:hypothetical protein
MPTPNQPPADFYCSQLAFENEEPMAGTAVSAPVWLLLEYRQTWLAKATSDNNLPTSVQSWLADQLSKVNGRLQFIRQTPQAGRQRCFIAVPDVQTPRLYRFDFAHHAELLNLDLTAIAENSSQFAPYLTSEPLFLICTNGKRDRCCAKFGTALYHAFSDEVGTAVWQTTHLGGHRFAPTLMSFPDGICYGRVTIGDIPELLQAQRNRELYLPKLRGRAVYDAVTQAAEFYLCQELGGSTSLEHISTHSTEENDWTVQFSQTPTNKTYQVVIKADPSQTIYASCGAQQPKFVSTYLLKQISSIN